jgi:hypothetical protein
LALGALDFGLAALGAAAFLAALTGAAGAAATGATGASDIFVFVWLRLSKIFNLKRNELNISNRV